MQNPGIKNTIKRAALAKSPLKSGIKEQKDKINRIADKIKQVEAEERPSKYSDNLDDRLNRVRNHEALN